MFNIYCLTFGKVIPYVVLSIKSLKLDISQVYIIGGDGTQKGASVIFEVIDLNFVTEKDSI